MDERFMTGANARWEVIWFSRKGKRFIVKEFEDDFHGALELYTRVKALKAPFITLRCCNVGFPPPEKYRPHYETRIKKERRNGRVRRVKTEVEVVPMEGLNVKGVWWCPYCREFRKFRMQDGAIFEDYYIEGKSMYCPVCEISMRDHHVRKWNPQAQTLVYKLRRRTRGSGRRSSRRRKGRR